MCPSKHNPQGRYHIQIAQLSERKKKRKKERSLSRVRLFATPWTVANQPPLPMEFSRQLSEVQ